jgi:hypothetical protein
MRGFRPLHDRVLLRRVEAEEKTPAGKKPWPPIDLSDCQDRRRAFCSHCVCRSCVDQPSPGGTPMNIAEANLAVPPPRPGFYELPIAARARPAEAWPQARAS